MSVDESLVCSFKVRRLDAAHIACWCGITHSRDLSAILQILRPQ